MPPNHGRSEARLRRSELRTTFEEMKKAGLHYDIEIDVRSGRITLTSPERRQPPAGNPVTTAAA